MTTIDLRSDTLTQPSPSMRKAMAEAEVGDDVFMEDPTVQALENAAAELTGKEAALYVASGTMANLVSVLTHCRRGDELILGDQAHIFFYEQGGCAALGGVHPRTVPNQADGTIALEDILAAIRPNDVHFPRTRLVALENTHNRCMGSPLDADYMRTVGEAVHERGLLLHVDGARICNAAAALDTEVRELTAPADSVSFCLSKGLGAPVGSLVCGSEAFIQEARRMRKVVGGGMRQSGVLAAAGLVALEEGIPRLPEDHANAKRLASGLAQIDGLMVDPERVRTNIVFFEVDQQRFSAEAYAAALADEGVRVLAPGPAMLRAVTHRHITAEDVDRALTAAAKAAKSL